MSSYLAAKHALKWTAARASICLAPFGRPPARPRACILVYHRVSPVRVRHAAADAWNVPPATFEAHARALATGAEVVPLSRLRERLRASTPPASRPVVCLTFDDGYACVHRHALPVLQRYALPATAFVVTAFVGTRTPMPFDAWGCHHAGRTPDDAWRPLTWGEAEACVASGLVTLGAHSDRHRHASRCSPADLVDEATRARDALSARFGAEQASAYSYPYGSRRLACVPEAYVAAVRGAGYTLGLTTDLGLTTAEDDPLLLPRVEACGEDSGASLLAKARGALAPQRLTDRLRRRARWSLPGGGAREWAGAPVLEEQAR